MFDIKNMENFIKPDFSNANVDYSLPRISISQLLGMIQEPFDQQGVAQKTFNKHYNNPDSQYYHKTVEEIIKMWSDKGAESCKYGSLLDDYIGNILTKTDNDVKLFKLDNNYNSDTRLHGLCDSFDNFYSVLSKSGDTVFVDREKSVYYPIEVTDPNDYTRTIKFNIKGRFDALFYNKRTNKWIIIDWKSSGSIDKVPNRWTKNLLGPMSQFPSLNYWLYTTQLYFYKKTLIEQHYLPDGTKPEDVIIMIVNLPGKLIEESGKNFATHQAAYQYDPALLDKLFVYGAQKQILMGATKEKEEEPAINESGDSDSTLESIF